VLLSDIVAIRISKILHLGENRTYGVDQSFSAVRFGMAVSCGGFGR